MLISEKMRMLREKRHEYYYRRGRYLAMKKRKAALTRTKRKGKLPNANKIRRK